MRILGHGFPALAIDRVHEITGRIRQICDPFHGIVGLSQRHAQLRTFHSDGAKWLPSCVRIKFGYHQVSMNQNRPPTPHDIAELAAINCLDNVPVRLVFIVHTNERRHNQNPNDEGLALSKKYEVANAQFRFDRTAKHRSVISWLPDRNSSRFGNVFHKTVSIACLERYQTE